MRTLPLRLPPCPCLSLCSPIWAQQDDLCLKTKCPVAAGPVEIVYLQVGRGAHGWRVEHLELSAAATAGGFDWVQQPQQCLWVPDGAVPMLWCSSMGPKVLPTVNDCTPWLLALAAAQEFPVFTPPASASVQLLYDSGAQGPCTCLLRRCCGACCTRFIAAWSLS